MSSSHYRIVVQGQLGERFSEAFDDMTQAPHGRDTVLEGPFIDRSQLESVFDRLRRLGIEISSFNTTPRGPNERKSKDDSTTTA
ncbi:MAG: hypothetical protein GY925_20895 [Actinomycetia bacterium]|nr:hypothetical protein [Actinomycetes bacterium]